MSVYAHVDGLGVVIEQCIADSVLEYRKANHQSTATVDTIAEHLRNVSTTVNLRPAGVAMITVECQGRRMWEKHIDAFRATRYPGGRWEVTASSISEV